MYKFDEEKVSLIKLQSHINVKHPRRQNGEKHSVFDEIGALPCLNSCFSKVPRIIKEGDKTFKKDTILVTELSESLGLGSTLFLQYTKSLAWLFFFLSILNIPTMVFFYTGQEAETEDLEDFFAKLTLGNIGEDQSICSTYLYPTTDNMKNDE